MGIKKNEKHILVVEDDAELCNSIMKALFDQGYTPAGATDIKDAAFKLKNQKYNCILLDLKLHNDSGVDLLVYIRERNDSLNLNIATPVLVISGELDADILKDLAGQVQGVLVKPFNIQSLVENVKKLAS